MKFCSEFMKLEGNNNMIFTTSWDDGNILDIKLANLLSDYNIRATFYIPISWKFKSLQNRDLRRISKKFEIGSHSVSHKDMTKISNGEIQFEVTKSKEILEKIMKRKISCFAFPFGKSNRNVQEIVKKANFMFARTTEEFYLEFPRNPFASNISISVSNNPMRILFPNGFYLKLKNGLKWERIAKEMLSRSLKRNSVFHLHGHSWEIEKENNWNELENFLNYISKLKEIEFLTNNEIIPYHQRRL